jgi:hypothetical protein
MRKNALPDGRASENIDTSVETARLERLLKEFLAGDKIACPTGRAPHLFL